MLKNVRFCVSGPGKNYPAVIKEKFSGPKLMFSKGFEEMKCSRRFLRQNISANSYKPCSKPHPQTGTPRVGLVRQFVPRLRAGWHPYTSGGLKRGVGALCAIVVGNNLGLAILESNTEIDTGRLGKSPSLPATVCRSFVPNFSVFNRRFCAHLVLFVPGAVAFQTSALQCLHSLPV